MSVSLRYSRSAVGASRPSSGWWRARMPIEPTSVRVETIPTSSSKTDPSGVSTSTRNGVCATASVALLVAAGRLDDVLDRALQEERRLRHVVVLAVDDLLEAADRLGDRDVLARRAGELLGDVEGLRQEALDAAGGADAQLLLVGGRRE